MNQSIACVLLSCLAVAACSSPDGDGGDDAPAEIDAAVEDELDASPPDAEPVSGPRNTQAVGDWTLTEDLASCTGFTGGFIGTALSDDDQFLLAFNDVPPGGTRLQTICTFLDDSAFTCEDISSTAQLGACFAAGSLDNIAGTITGATFTIAGDGSGNASAQCPGGPRSCGPAAASAAGTITP